MVAQQGRRMDRISSHDMYDIRYKQLPCIIHNVHCRWTYLQKGILDRTSRRELEQGSISKHVSRSCLVDRSSTSPSFAAPKRNRIKSPCCSARSSGGSIDEKEPSPARPWRRTQKETSKEPCVPAPLRVCVYPCSIRCPPFGR